MEATGLFDSPAAAARVVRHLEESGFSASEISVVTADGTRPEAFAIEDHTKIGEGLAVGAGFGGALGAVVAGLAAAGTIVTGGVGILATGPLLATLVGAGLGAAAGGAVGAAAGLSIPEHEVKFYDDALREGGVLVSVRCDDDEERSTATDVFEKEYAQRITTS
jgi:hypothetical protein